MSDIKTTLNQVEEIQLKSFKSNLKKIKKDLGISRDTSLKDDNIVKRKKELMILSHIINQATLNVLSMNWFCEEDIDYICQELSKIEKRISEIDSSLIELYTTILKSIDR